MHEGLKARITAAMKDGEVLGIIYRGAHVGIAEEAAVAQGVA